MSIFLPSHYKICGEGVTFAADVACLPSRHKICGEGVTFATDVAFFTKSQQDLW
jgi:hypothetical protein